MCINRRTAKNIFIHKKSVLNISQKQRVSHFRKLLRFGCHNEIFVEVRRNHSQPGLILYSFVQCLQVNRARICKPFKEPRNRFPAWHNRSLGSKNVYKYIRAQYSFQSDSPAPGIRLNPGLKLCERLQIFGAAEISPEY
jgi:hypothetical protein